MKIQNKNKLIKLTLINSAFLISIALTGCGGGSGPGSNVPDTGIVDSFSTSVVPDVTQETIIGTVFTSNQGKSLYTFEVDTAGVSNCNADCENIWPPLFAADNAKESGDFSVIVRDDGSKQWAFKQYPLYFFNKDEVAGDVNGENVNQVWFVARPDPWQEKNVDDTTRGIVFSGMSSVINVTDTGAISTVRKDRDGFSLYTFKSDDSNAGSSSCNGMCATVWPPLYADKGARSTGDFNIITRDDGSQQWAFKSYPIYFYKFDTTQGQTLGHGIIGAGDFWYVARPDPIKVIPSNISTILAGKGLLIDVDENGNQSTSKKDRDDFSLYTFDTDVVDSGNSSCNGMCANVWPPLYAEAGAKESDRLSIIIRDDETKQWAYQGKPLYFFKNDLVIGETNGDNFFGANNFWYVARTAPVQRSLNTSQGDIMVARGKVADVDSEGIKASSKSDKTGASLYTFDDDVKDSGQSSCNAGCAVTWPPLYAESTDRAGGDFNIIKRNDGTLQWSFKGLPLYFFINDQNVGDLNGVYPGWKAVQF